MADEEKRRQDAARDVLAAEEFGVPAPDPALMHHGPITLPADPTGIAGPHDVLAAEEFALPAPRYGGGEPHSVSGRGGFGRQPAWLAAAALAAFAFALRKRRS